MKNTTDAGIVRDEIAVTGGRLLDLGLAVDASSVTAGSASYSNWIDDAEWVRNLVVLAQSDQQFDIVIQRRDKSLTGSADGTLSATQGAASSFWRAYSYSGSSALAGYSFRIGIKNSSASTATYCRLRVQAIGL